MEITPIGTIETPFDDLEHMPVQPAGAAGVTGRVIVDAEYEQGLSDIDGFSHLILLYRFHRSTGYDLMVKPFLDDTKRGLFATRAPRRPNQIGLSIVRLTARQGRVLTVRGIDVLNGTPLIDIKPYVPKFDVRDVTATGWLEKNQDRAESVTSDDRFVERSNHGKTD